MSSFLSQLNDRQQEAAGTIHGPVMIIAGAGSGKTRVLTYRTAHMLAERQAAPWQILMLTFTNKAAKEMKTRIAALIGEQVAAGIWMGTFHSIFARILRMDGDKLGYDRNFSIYDTDDQESLIKKIMADLSINHQQFPVRQMMSKISASKNRLWYPADLEKFAVHPADIKAAQVFKDYQIRLKESNSMDFDDLLMKPIELFTKSPETLKKYQNQFKYLMIDEYQDTNKAQYTIAKLLAASGRNIAVVGDDAQSIYSWRGADIQNILDFEKDYPEAKVVRLEQNYRSTKRILAVADAVIKSNKEQIPKTLWTDNDEGDFITLLECDSERDESMRVANYIQQFKITKGMHNKDFAILYRTNAQSRALEDGLRRIAVPYVIIGGIQFYKRKEVKDVLAYLKILVNPRDTESFRRIVNYPARNIGEVALAKIEEYAHQTQKGPAEILSVIDMVPGLTARQRSALQELNRVVQETRNNLTNSPLGLLIRTYVEELHLISELGQDQTQEGRTRVENVQELINAIEEFSVTRQDATLEAFLQDVSLVADTDNLDNDRNVVTLMTLHAAKGLEFPVVFICGLEEGLFPFSGGAERDSNLEEERRLCYVGITRAEKKLFISHAKTRFRFGSTEYTVRSRFIDEMDLSQIKTEGQAPVETRNRFATRGLDGDALGDYANKDPYYWRDEKYTQPKGSPATKVSKERSVVYDEGEVAIKTGIYVEHAKFGRGKVTSVDGSGDNRKAVVFFVGHGAKTLVLKFANLKVVK
ncbi:MAG: UvrD-helicase domain-containing protein [Bacteroidetes bacterium]|nr:UvrD-helicase domain-containing protein [Bacteroidota bacterium]